MNSQNLGRHERTHIGVLEEIRFGAGNGGEGPARMGTLYSSNHNNIM